jgi:hypothetical protein
VNDISCEQLIWSWETQTDCGQVPQEISLQILKADLDPTVTRLGHIRTHLSNIEIQIHAPSIFMLGPPLQLAYLQRILASNPIVLSFGLDVWTPDKKVLHARYVGRTIEVISFRRGLWENDLIAAAQYVEARRPTLMLSRRTSFARKAAGALI